MNFGATILDAEGLRLSAEEKALFRDTNPFGFILFGRNIESADQVRALCADMRESVGRDCPITIDQEGGRVQRLRAPMARDWLPPLDHVAQAGAGAERAMYLRYRLIANELRDLGIDSNCAPMVDVIQPGTHDFLRNRCYGDDPAQVAALGRAVADGMLDGGVLPVLKHIPGHGRATADSHFDLPEVAADSEDLHDMDFAPFHALADLPMAMTAHVVYSAVSPLPATLSPEVIGLIRSDMGFDGLLMTDDLSMKALQGSMTDLTRQALGAGCDVILLCNQDFDTRAQVANTAGEMTEQAQIRAQNVLGARKSPAPLDIDAAEADLSRLMGGTVYAG